ncbi:PREDICTED: uncharacterized protein LOC104801335 [Tarenaya hassleriana]|uniref:uncharacterized protein LOC104801335 n=1 Tax=Tarenaya hassleriana TaxID=28532 RepID=UPI00053C8B9F|nr:PREDICTED: uncharacterized protein LOC104801335 [Tarenaya hassleriana]
MSMTMKAQEDETRKDGKAEELLGDDGVSIEIKKLGKNSRRIHSKVGIEASLDSVWNVLTNYEKLSDVYSTLVSSELVEKEGNRSRVLQIAQKSLLGVKVSAKVVLDFYEKDLEILPNGKRRDIEFKMVEGNFHSLQGKWTIEQFDEGETSESEAKDVRTTLSYLVDVQPKPWLPVGLIEGRFCNEIEANLSGIRQASLKPV